MAEAVDHGTIKRAFISHVHEDSDQIDEICAALEAYGIPYWRDRNQLGPGDDLARRDPRGHQFWLLGLPGVLLT